MGVYSTQNISRSEAIRQIQEEEARRKQLDHLSNEELEERMFQLFGDRRLENYIVIND